MKNRIIPALFCGVLLSACSDTSREPADDVHSDTMTAAHAPVQQDGKMQHGMMNDEMMGQMGRTIIQQLATKKGDDFDKAFLPLMTTHHEGGIAMAQQALEKAAHPELKKFAADLIAAQKEEISTMNQWFQNWFSGENFGANDSGMGAHMMQMLSGKDGDDFDAQFLRMMTMHHRHGIMMSKMAVTNSAHNELKALAQKMIASQEKEITQLQQWQQQWYGAAQ